MHIGHQMLHVQRIDTIVGQRAHVLDQETFAGDGLMGLPDDQAAAVIQKSAHGQARRELRIGNPQRRPARRAPLGKECVSVFDEAHADRVQTVEHRIERRIRVEKLPREHSPELITQQLPGCCTRYQRHFVARGGHLELHIAHRRRFQFAHRAQAATAATQTARRHQLPLQLVIETYRVIACEGKGSAWIDDQPATQCGVIAPAIQAAAKTDHRLAAHHGHAFDVGQQGRLQRQLRTRLQRL